MTVDKTVALILQAVDTLDESMEPESCQHLRMQARGAFRLGRPLGRRLRPGAQLILHGHVVARLGFACGRIR